MSMLSFFRSRRIGYQESGIGKDHRNPRFLIPNSHTGFTLLEVLIAVAILGSALAVILGAVNRSLVIASESKNLAIAEALVQTKMSEIELEGFPKPREERGEFAGAPGFKWALSVKPLNVPGLDTEIMVVNLIISWDEGKRDFEVTLAMSNTK